MTVLLTSLDPLVLTEPSGPIPQFAFGGLDLTVERV
jgi:hypothetical protein